MNIKFRIFNSQKSKRPAHVTNFIMVICALLPASKINFDRSSTLGHSIDRREFAEIFLLFLAKNRKRNFSIFRIENAQNKINRDHFRISGFVLNPTRLFSFKTWATIFLNIDLGFIIGPNSTKYEKVDF